MTLEQLCSKVHVQGCNYFRTVVHYAFSSRETLPMNGLCSHIVACLCVDQPKNENVWSIWDTKAADLCKLTSRGVG